MPRRAFTLIELLVVVSLIVLLISLLMPALGQARKQARSVTCMSNLKQFAAIDAAYKADFDNWHLPMCVPAPDIGYWRIWHRNPLFLSMLGIPDDGAGFYQVPENLKQLLCPDAAWALSHPGNKAQGKYDFAPDPAGDEPRYAIRFSYAMNGHIDTPWYADDPADHDGLNWMRSFRANKVNNPSVKLFMSDALWPDCYSWGALRYPLAEEEVRPPDSYWGSAWRHNYVPQVEGVVNTLFFDGHVGGVSAGFEASKELNQSSLWLPYQ